MISLEILAYEPTPLGILCLRRRELVSKPGTMVTEVTLNHEFLMSSYLTLSERELTRMGLERISNAGNCSVLVGGLGLGYTAFEALSNSAVTSVKVIEFLPQVIDWMESELTPLSTELKQNPRLCVEQGDIYDKLTTAANEKFDLIVIDVDHSPEDVLGAQSQSFYSENGLQIASTHLNPNGVIGIWSYAEDTPLLAAMKTVFDDVSVEQVTVMNDLIDEQQTDWLFFGRAK